MAPAFFGFARIYSEKHVPDEVIEICLLYYSPIMINIGGDEKDINWKYKMPELMTKIEDRGNRKMTVLMNIWDIAKALYTEPSYVTKFLAFEFGDFPSQYDSKRQVGILDGVYQTKELQTTMKKFIKEFILCPKCKLPQLQYKIRRTRGGLLQKCAACGWKGVNTSNHKVKTYIINHPPVKTKKKTIKKKKGVKGTPTKHAS